MICEICGKTFYERMWDESSDYANCCSRECFNVKFWREKAIWMENGDITEGQPCARINHVHYVIGEEQKKGYKGFLGYGGQEFHIRFTDGPHAGKEFITHNLWDQGRIPTEFHDMLPDNAVWVKQEDRGLYQ